MPSFFGLPRAGALAMALFIAGGFQRLSPAQEKPDNPSHDVGLLLPTNRIAKFGKVTPNLYRGGQPNSEGLAALKKMGIDIVVDMRSGNREEEHKAVTKLGMDYVHIPWHCPFPSDQALARFLKLVEDNPEKKIFVHCRLGDDRTGMAVAAYRMAEQGWSAEDAMKEMHNFGFNTFHHAICPGLAGYERSFPERLKEKEPFKNLRHGGESKTETKK